MLLQYVTFPPCDQLHVLRESKTRKDRHKIPATSVQQSPYGPGSRSGLHRFHELLLRPPNRETSKHLTGGRQALFLHPSTRPRKKLKHKVARSPREGKTINRSLN